MTNEHGAGRGSAPPLVVLEHIIKRFPGVLANDDVSLELRPARGARVDRRERRGEVHADAGAVRDVSRRWRPDHGPRPGGEDRVASRRDRPGHRHGPPALRAGGPVHRHREHHPGQRGSRDPGHRRCRAPRAGAGGHLRVPRAAGRRDRGALRRRGAARRDPEGAVPRRRDPDPGRADGGPHARSRPRTCSSTSASSATPARRSCSSATSSTRSCRSPTASRCCAVARSWGRPRRPRRRRPSSPR